MKIIELKKLIESVPDDFDFEVTVRKEIPEETLKTMSYPYPYDLETCETKVGDYDIGWSSEVFNIGVEIKEI